MAAHALFESMNPVYPPPNAVFFADLSYLRLLSPIDLTELLTVAAAFATAATAVPTATTAPATDTTVDAVIAVTKLTILMYLLTVKAYRTNGGARLV